MNVEKEKGKSNFMVAVTSYVFRVYMLTEMSNVWVPEVNIWGIDLD